MNSNLPVILLRGTVLLPEAEIKLEFNDEFSKSIIEEAELFHNKQLLVVSKLTIEENIQLKELPKIGTIAYIQTKLELPDGRIRIVLKGLKRANVLKYINPSKDVFESIVIPIPLMKVDENTKQGLINKLYQEIDNYTKKVTTVSNSLLSIISNVNDINSVTDIIVNYIFSNQDIKLKYLCETNPVKRTEMILADIYKEEQLFNISKNIDTKVKKNIDKEQKDFFIKEQIKLLKQELGDNYEGNEISSLNQQLELLNLDDKISSKISSEIDRYKNMSSMSPEISIVKRYIDTMLSLPWNKLTKDETNLSKIKEELDKTHYGINQVKERIVEYLALKQFSNNADTPIICLVGPSGVGKTTLAYSIAKSMNRNFVKISMGGVDDEAIIKGHVRTYVGSTYGKIIDEIIRADSLNPVFLIDEIDKMSNNYKGDPASALLEVLDCKQNKYFKDNYIEEEFDLSNVLFITTANDISKIPLALKDRLEIINVSSYTEFEKLTIVKDYLIPTICSNYDIKNIKIKDNDILEIIRYYTKEAGVRELNRLISKIVRKIITDKVLNNKKMVLTISNIEKYLGKKIYTVDDNISEIGKVFGLAYTEYGGDILPIEVNTFDGNSNLILTGSLGDETKESAKIALSYIKANYKLFNIDKKVFKNDIHINIPNISIRKDGCSAGIAITTSLISALSNLNISNKIAMSGEITLRGNVLKIGGLKEKILGAYLNNINTIFIPSSNIIDLEEIPKEIKDKINIIPVKKYEEVYNYLMEGNNE